MEASVEASSQNVFRLSALNEHIYIIDFSMGPPQCGTKKVFAEPQVQNVRQRQYSLFLDFVATEKLIKFDL